MHCSPPQEFLYCWRWASSNCLVTMWPSRILYRQTWMETATSVVGGNIQPHSSWNGDTVTHLRQRQRCTGMLFTTTSYLQLQPEVGNFLQHTKVMTMSKSHMSFCLYRIELFTCKNRKTKKKLKGWWPQLVALILVSEIKSQCEKFQSEMPPGCSLCTDLHIMSPSAAVFCLRCWTHRSATGWCSRTTPTFRLPAPWFWTVGHRLLSFGLHWSLGECFSFVSPWVVGVTV